jgi:hypothetical protein
MFIRKGDKGQPELVLIDHGLYRELSNEFRSGSVSAIMQDCDCACSYCCATVTVAQDSVLQVLARTRPAPHGRDRKVQPGAGSRRDARAVRHDGFSQGTH